MKLIEILTEYHIDPVLLPGHEMHRLQLPDVAFTALTSNELKTKQEKDAAVRAIAKSPKYAYRLALRLKRRFPLAEKNIAKDGEYSYFYAKDIIKGPWKDGEAAIAKDGYYSFLYARDVLKGRFDEGEPAILKTHYKNDYKKFLFDKRINISGL